MAQAIHVNGPAVIYIGDSLNPFGAGGGGTLKQLGVAESGAEIIPERLLGEVKTDAAGPAAPADLINFGKTVTIEVSLSVWDEAVRQYVESMDVGDDLDVGTIGLLIGTSGNALRVVIDSEFQDPWRFYCCIPRGRSGGKLSTHYTPWRLSFFSWALVGASASSAGMALGDRIKG